jgi:serine/threonine-protein kinase
VAVKRGLSWRIGGLMAALAAALIVSGIGVVWWRTHRLATPALERAVLRAGDLVEDAVASRLDRLDLVARLLSNDPPFRAYVAEGDRVSILDILSDRLGLLACDAFVLTDGRGVPLADTRRPRQADPAAQQQGPVPDLVRRALQGEPASGVWLEPDGTLFLAAAAPLAAGEAAVLVALEAMDGDLLSWLRQTTGAELALFARTGGEVRAGATTLALSRSELASLLAGAEVLPGAPPRRLEADGEDFVAVAMPLGDDAGFLALRSVDRELDAFRKIQWALLLVGVAALPVALGVGVVAARRIAGPIAQLARATERVRAGDYAVSLPADTGDEVGALAGAFRAMISRLKEKEDLDAWIGALAARAARGEQPLSGGQPRDVDSQSATVARRAAEPVAGGGPLQPGMVLHDRFRVLEPLGAGGMGMVWKARDEQLGEFVAIKVLPPDQMRSRPELVERFRQEIRLARRVTHRNVLRTHELLEFQGNWAILMECIDGVPLSRLLASGRLPLAAGLRIARQICAGLEAAHAQGVVHRDLKPANIMVDAAGGVKIADFGLACAADADGAETRAGVIVGTPQYMSPEQAAGRRADRRSDVYSAGVVFYELFCGRLPFIASSALAAMKAHVETPPQPPRTVQPNLPAAIESVLLKALAKDPQERFASANELQEALAGAVDAGTPS